MPCDHAAALVLITRRNHNGEPQISWCPTCGALRVLNAHLSRWIAPSKKTLPPSVLADLRHQQQPAP